MQNQLEEAGRDLQKQGRELREDIKDGASEQEIRNRLDAHFSKQAKSPAGDT